MIIILKILSYLLGEHVMQELKVLLKLYRNLSGNLPKRSNDRNSPPPGFFKIIFLAQCFGGEGDLYM